MLLIFDQHIQQVEQTPPGEELCAVAVTLCQICGTSIERVASKIGMTGTYAGHLLKGLRTNAEFLQRIRTAIKQIALEAQANQTPPPLSGNDDTSPGAHPSAHTHTEASSCAGS